MPLVVDVFWLMFLLFFFFFFFSSRRRHTRCSRDWSSDVCSSDLGLDLKPGDVAARANFCTLDAKGIVTDRRAGRIETEVRSEERRVGKSVDLGGRRISKKKKKKRTGESNNRRMAMRARDSDVGED